MPAFPQKFPDLYDVAQMFNVRTYGAVLNGVTDDTAAIQAALDAAGVSGGVVVLPPGRAKITAQLNINTKRGVALVGEPQSYSMQGTTRGSALVWAGLSNSTMLRIFNSSDIVLEGFSLDGDNISDVTGILVDSDNAPVTKRLVYNRLNFLRLNIGIQLNTHIHGDSQTDANWIDNCAWYEMNSVSGACIVANSQNVTLNVSNCEFLGARYGIRFLRCGFARMEFIAAGSPGVNVMDFITQEGPCGQLIVESCQCEQAAHFIFRVAGAPAQAQAINLIGCIIDVPIQLDSRVLVNSIGNYYNAALNSAVADVYVTSLNDSSSIGEQFNLTGTNAALWRLLDALTLGKGATPIRKHLSVTTVWNPGTINAGAFATITLNVPGAVIGDTVVVAMGSPQTISGGLILTAQVISDTGNVALTLYNATGGSVPLIQNNVRIDVWKH